MTPEEIIGKTILVGITYYNKNNDTVDHREQFAGAVVSANEDGIGVQKADESIFTLPPDMSAISKAAPGEYRLRYTGEIVVNPDLVSTWNLFKD